MTRWVHASTLTVGRCFYVPPPVDESGLGSATEPASAAPRPLIAPERVYRVDVGGERITATSATGEVAEFAGDTRVHEVPRAGFDRLRTTTSG